MQPRTKSLILLGLVIVLILIISYNQLFSLVWNFLNSGLGFFFESENFVLIVVVALLALIFVVGSIIGYIVSSVRLVNSKKSRLDYLMTGAPILVILSCLLCWLNFHYMVFFITLLLIIPSFLLIPSLYGLYRLVQRKYEYLTFFIFSILLVPIQLALIILFIARFIGW